MIDTPDPDAAEFDSAHRDLLELQSHPTVQSLARDVMAGLLTAEGYARALLAVPEVNAAVKTMGGIGIAAASAAVAGATPFGLGLVTGPAAGAFMAMALNAAVGAAKK